MLASLNYLLVLKCLLKPSLRIPLSVIGRCSLVPTSHWLQGKCAGINLSRAASGMNLQYHRRVVSIFSVKIAALGSLKRVTGWILKISNLFSSTKKQKKIVKTISARTESTSLLKNSHLVTQSL